MGSGLAAVERAVDHVAVRPEPGQAVRLRLLLHAGGLQLPHLRQGLQAEEQPEEPSKVGVRQGAPVQVSPLRLQGEAEDAHRAAHGADAQGAALQAGARVRAAEGADVSVCSSSASFPVARARAKEALVSPDEEARTKRRDTGPLSRTTDVRYARPPWGRRAGLGEEHAGVYRDDDVDDDDDDDDDNDNDDDDDDDDAERRRGQWRLRRAKLTTEKRSRLSLLLGLGATSPLVSILDSIFFILFKVYYYESID